MRIKRLRLTGFKSFVDPADLRIEPGLTGVVGPNGCGKSNLLEALRWVMGETSAKSMRGAGMEDVIFAGTATRPARDFAEVSILADQTLDVGTGTGDELEVVRRIERGAGSAYRINGRDVRAKDVALAFADAATGAHSPALVSQGRIGAIIAAKPAERRAMLEEAAGIAGLHVRRKDAEGKLRATETNLQRLDELIADQSARAAALRRQARAAERYRALSTQIRVAEARMIFARWRDAAAASDAAKAEAARAEADVTACTATVRDTDAAQAAATERLVVARAASLAARDRVSEATHALSALRAERDAVLRRIAEIEQARTRLAEDRAREGTLAEDAAAALAGLKDESATLTARIAAAGERTPALEAALTEAERTARDAEVALAQALTAQAEQAAEVRVRDAALAAARQRLDRVQRDHDALAAEVARLSDPAPVIAARDAAVAARETASTALASARTALAAAESRERGLGDQRATTVSARAAAAAELAALDREATALAKALEGGSRDRLLDRVAPRPGYERALAAALGDDLDAGLDPAGERHWAGASTLPGDPPALDGTHPLGSYVDAPAPLARRLAQVFVVDRDAGEPLAVGQRLVTRDGQLRRWDGFVARGNGVVAAERLERRNRLTALQAARPSLAEAVTAAELALARADADAAEIRATLQQHRTAIAQHEAAIRQASQAEDRAAAELERIAARRDDLATRAHRIEAELADARHAAEHAVAERAAAPDGTATRERVAQLSDAADRARTAVASARSERQGHDRALAADRERLAAASAEAKGWRDRAGEAAQRIADLARRESSLDSEAATLTGRPEALSSALDEAENALLVLREQGDTAQGAERSADADLRTHEAAARVAAEALATAREARAGAAARAESAELRRVEMGRLSGERFECPPPLLPERAGFDSATVRTPADESAAHERLTTDRERIGPVNLIAETELAELDAASTTNAAERDELAQAVNRLRGSIGTLNREGRDRLRAAFESVDGHFRRLFTTLFNGGQAHLALIDSDDPLEAGLEIMAQPPGKRLQSLTLLSGGEQALTAVALIFALFLTNPAPICVLDEVDAPLDDANIDRFCDLLDRMVQETDTRYLIVTHNAATMSRMHRLFGVTMVEQGVSRLVSVDLGGAETLLAAE
jgi:chromosome segregation protein